MRWRRDRTKKSLRGERRVYMAIIRGVRFGYDIAQETGLPVRRLYLALVRLEVKGMIKGYWETDLYDRPHRAYEVVDD